MDTPPEIFIDSLFNALSSQESLEILHLLQEQGQNLTDTANHIAIPISTTQDKLRKLVESNLVFIEKKTYHLSSLGNYLLSTIQNLEALSKLRYIFGHIPANSLPMAFLEELIPIADQMDFQESPWHFLNIFDQLLNQFKREIQDGSFSSEIRIIGWWNLDFDLELLNTYFPQQGFDPHFYINFIKNVKIRLLGDKTFADELLRDENFKELGPILDEYKYIQIIEDDKPFNFTLIEIEGTIGMFLVKNHELDFKHHFFLTHPKAHDLFDRVFKSYAERAISLQKYSKRSRI